MPPLTMARFKEPDEPRPIGICARESCSEYLYEGQEVYKYEDVDLCSVDCVIDHLLKEGVIECIDLTKEK